MTWTKLTNRLFLSEHTLRSSALTNIWRHFVFNAFNCFLLRFILMTVNIRTQVNPEDFITNPNVDDTYRNHQEHLMKNSNNIIAPLSWCPRPLQTLDYAEVVFWVSKLNISDGLFLGRLFPRRARFACVCVSLPTLVLLTHCLEAAFDPLSHLHVPPGLYQSQLTVDTSSNKQDLYRLFCP